MHEMNAMNAPNEISTSARLKFKSINENGNGIQSITWPSMTRSMRFESAPPDITARPKCIIEFIFVKKRTQRRITHAIPERIRVKTCAPPNIPKAAPAL